MQIIVFFVVFPYMPLSAYKSQILCGLQNVFAYKQINLQTCQVLTA